ncbi:hypothetical protein Lal_00025296, partial [Lupinus albus]
MRMIILVEEEEAEKEVGVEEDMKIFNSLQLSLYSMKGNHIHQIPKNRREPVEETKAYLVEVGDGHNVKCQGKCPQLKFYMQQLEVDRENEINSQKGDSVITIVGDRALNRTKLSYGAFMQVLLENMGGLRLHYDTGQCYRQEGEGIPAKLEGTMQQYQDVFQNSQGLPPSRRQDHAIHLKNGAKFWFNSNYNSSTRMSHFRPLYDRKPPILLKASTIQNKFTDFTLED